MKKLHQREEGKTWTGKLHIGKREVRRGSLWYS